MAEWIAEQALTISSPEHDDAVSAAFDKPDAVVFGWHYHFAGGASRSPVVFTSLRAYRARLASSRPGDHFTLFDLDAVASLARRHDGDRRSARPIPVNVEGLPDDLVLVRRLVSPDSLLAAELEELEGDNQGRPAVRGEFFLFDADVFDEDHEGGHITSVTATHGSRRHALVDAKVSNADGLIPRTGPY